MSFYGSTYRSPYLTFTPVETTTNQPSGSYYKTLETPTPAETALWQAKQPQQQTFPFIDIGGKWLLQNAQYPPQALEGHSFNDITDSIGSNDNTIGVYVDASAAVLDQGHLRRHRPATGGHLPSRGRRDHPRGGHAGRNLAREMTRRRTPMPTGAAASTSQFHGLADPRS